MAEIGPSFDTSNLAKKSEMPTPATSAPKSEASSSAIGGQTSKYALEDHRHPRITWSRNIMLDAKGVGVADFSSKPFPTKPVPSFSKVSGAAGPCSFEVTSWIMNGSDYVGANIKGYRTSGPSQTLASVSVVGITVAVGGQTVTTYGNAANVEVSVIMLPDSGA